MRKSTVVILVMLLVAGAGTLFLADAYLGPAKEDVGVGQRITRLFGDRGDLAPGSVVKVRRVARAEGREVPGLNVEITPSPAVQSRAGALRSLARAVAREASEAYGLGGPGLRWFRVRVFLTGDERRETLLWRDTDDQVGEPDPPLPSVWPPAGGPPGAGSPAVPGKPSR